MIIANLLGATKLALMNSAEVTAWENSKPIDQDLVYNTDTKSFFVYDGTAGSAIDEGAPVTTWKVDAIAPTGTSYYSAPETIGRVILLFMLDGVPFWVRNAPATQANQIYHDRFTGMFELQINVTPAIQFNGEWLHIIYNNDTPAV